MLWHVCVWGISGLGFGVAVGFVVVVQRVQGLEFRIAGERVGCLHGSFRVGLP